jgi:hypothetical protein
MNMVSNLNFVFSDLGEGPFLPVEEVIIEPYVPVISSNLDFESESNFEIVDNLKKEYSQFVSLVLNCDFKFMFKLHNNGNSFCMKSKSPLFNDKSNFLLQFKFLKLNEDIDFVGVEDSEVDDLEIIVVLEVKLPFCKMDDPVLFFVVHQSLVL